MGSKIEGTIYRVWAQAPNDHISIRRDDGNHFQPLDAGQGLAGKLKQGDRVELVLGEGAVALHVRGNGEECGTEEFAWLETEVDVESSARLRGRVTFWRGARAFDFKFTVMLI